jgi:pSer/pThr/pTyr-binding forkhead associated (FHA) protein
MQRYVLSVQEGRKPGQIYELHQDVVTIGRVAGRSDIALGDRTMSPVHARFIRLGTGTYGIEDLRSANGTFLNGQIVPMGTIRPLQDGDHLQFGDVVLVFRKQGL